MQAADGTRQRNKKNKCSEFSKSRNDEKMNKQMFRAKDTRKRKMVIVTNTKKQLSNIKSVNNQINI